MAAADLQREDKSTQPAFFGAFLGFPPSRCFFDGAGAGVLVQEAQHFLRMRATSLLHHPLEAAATHLGVVSVHEGAVAVGA
jgi:hypothetical protein